MTAPRGGADGPERSARKLRGRKPAAAPEPLGSISQGDDLLSPGGTACRSCGGASLTQLRMVLGDGTPVVFVSCHQCEQKSWLALDGTGASLSRADVLARSAKR